MEPSRRIRVLHVVPSYWPATAYGGPIESVHALCLAQAKSGASVRVLTTDADGPRRLPVQGGTEAPLSPGLRVRYCVRWGGGSISPGLLMSLLGEVSRCDVVHVTAVYSFPTIPALLAARIRNRPVVWSPRGALQSWDGASRPRLKSIWRSVCSLVLPSRTILHVTSASEAEASRRAFPKLDAEVIPNGIDVPEAILRTPPSGPLRLVFLGRLHPIKALENLIDACALCSSHGWEGWSLSIAGEGSALYEATLRERVASAGIAPRVAFLGPVRGEKKRDLFASADLVVVPSHSENFSMVVVEALAHGVPVVASTGTPWSALPQRGCGWWVDNAPERLAEAILSSRAADREAMGERGREWMRRDYEWGGIASRMMAMYRRLAGEKAR